MTTSKPRTPAFKMPEAAISPDAQAHPIVDVVQAFVYLQSQGDDSHVSKVAKSDGISDKLESAQEYMDAALDDSELELKQAIALLGQSHPVVAEAHANHDALRRWMRLARKFITRVNSVMIKEHVTSRTIILKKSGIRQ